MCPHSTVGGRGGRLPVDGAERRQLQLGGGALVVDVDTAGGGGGWGSRWTALVAAAAAAVQEGSGERLAQAEQQHRRYRRLTEEQQLADQIKDVQGSSGNTSCHIHCHNIAYVLRDDGEAV